MISPVSSMICGPALVAEFLLDFLQLVDDHAAQHFLGAQDLQVLGDPLLDFGQLVQDLLLLHAGQALELQLDDGLRLPLGESRTARIGVDQLRVRFRLGRRDERHQRFAGFLGIFAARISAITSSRLSSACWKPSKICSRSRALRSR